MVWQAGQSTTPTGKAAVPAGNLRQAGWEDTVLSRQYSRLGIYLNLYTAFPSSDRTVMYKHSREQAKQVRLRT